MRYFLNDVAKIRQREGEEVAIALFRIENQTAPEKYMPFRVFGYEGNSYNSQIEEYGKIVYPVVTIVLYFGKKPWNYPLTALGNIEVSDALIPIGTKIWKMCLLISRKIGIFPYKKEPMDIISTDSI